MDEINPGTLTVPTGLPKVPPMKVDMGGILAAESRIQEVAIVNPVKAPELMATFNQAYSDLTEIISKVEYQYEVAKIQEEKARAICIIDRVPGILKEKGLTSTKSPSGSEDMRSAVLALDPEYEAAQEKVIQLKCILTYLEGKLKAIDMAYTGVKKVFGDTSQYRHSPDLSVEPGQPSSFFKKY